MKKGVILLCLITFGSFSARCQTFLKYFAIDSIATESYCVELRDSFFFAAGICADTSVPYGISSFLAKFDYSGNMISDTVFRPKQFEQYVATRENSMITLRDKGLAAVGYARDSTEKIWLSFTKFDSAGNVVLCKAIDPGVVGYRTIFAYRLVESDNNGYFISGEMQLANNAIKTFLIKLDSTGAFEFTRVYNSVPLDNGARGLTKLSGGHLLVSSYSNQSGINYWQTSERTCFLEVDTDGNLIHQYCTSDTNTMAYYNVSPTFDGGYLSSGSYYSDRTRGMGMLLNEYVVKWDTGFNIIWQQKAGDKTDENSFSDFEQDTHDNIILCGQNLVDTGFAAGFNGAIAKVNKEGHIEWFREYKVPTGLSLDNSYNYLYDIDLLPNGNIVAIGSWETSKVNSPLYFPQVGWILKLDSNGCMDNGDCGLTDISGPSQNNSEANQNPFQVFPNPSNGAFTVHANMDMPSFTQLEVYDAMGKKILTQPLFGRTSLINLYYLPAGIYFYRIGNDAVSFDKGKLVIQK
jgi:hypothetical protein